MTNYNKRLDELMPCDCKFLKGFAWRNGDPCEGCINGRLKQAITSLIKELVAEAKPPVIDTPSRIKLYADDEGQMWYDRGQNDTIARFEQNLLNVLEEK